MSVNVVDSTSVRLAERRLREKGLLDEIQWLPEIWARDGLKKEGKIDLLRENGAENWILEDEKLEIQMDLGPKELPRKKRLTPQFDAYNRDARIVVEHEDIEQMRARWHLLKMDIAYRNSELLPVDIAVLLMESSEGNPTLDRTHRELHGPVFNEYLPLKVPVYALEYSTEK
jgi:hypothetical protein